MRLEAPIALVGLIALSVEIRMQRSTPNSARHLHQQAGRKGIVFDGFAGLGFHQRHMFVRCGMENDMGLVFGKNTAQPWFVQDIGHERT